MPDATDVLVIRPEPRGRASSTEHGEGLDQPGRRRVPIPALVIALVVVGYWFADGVADGVLTTLAMGGGAFGTVALLVVVVTATQRPRAVRVTADELVIDGRLGRRRRHPLSAIEGVETTRVVVGRVVDHEVTFVLGPPGRRLSRPVDRRRVLLTLSRQHWDAADIAALVGQLGVRHVIHRDEVLRMGQVRRRYRRAFVITTRRPIVSAVVLAALLLAGIVALLSAFA